MCKVRVWICRVFLCLMLAWPVLASAGVQQTADIAKRVKQTLAKLGASPHDVYVIPHPIDTKQVYAVMVKYENGKTGLMLVSSDVKYMIVGMIYDISRGRLENVTQKLILHDKKAVQMFVSSASEAVKGKKASVDMNDVKKGAVVVGKASAPRLYLFVDPLCPYCMRELKELAEHVKKGDVSLGIRYTIVHGKDALDAAAYAECIRHKKGENVYLQYISGVNRKVKVQCSAKELESYKHMILDSSDRAMRMGIRGTPSTVFNGMLFMGYRPWIFWKTVLAGADSKHDEKSRHSNRDTDKVNKTGEQNGQRHVEESTVKEHKIRKKHK